MCALTISTEMMTASNTIEAIAGAALLVVSIILSIKSRTFLRLSFKKFKHLFIKNKSK